MRVRSKLVALFAACAFALAGGVADARPDDRGDQAAGVDAATRERSRAAFRKGVAQLRAQDWAGARASFEEAWSLVQHPSILLNLGIARLRTDDPVLAEQALVRFLSEDSGAAPEELSSARDALAEARAQIGTLRVLVGKPTARVVVDGEPVPVRALGEGDAAAEVRVKAGAHHVQVSAPGFVSDERDVDVPAKVDTDVRVALVAEEGTRTEPQPAASAPSTSTRSIVGWSLAGVAGGALVASGVMGMLAISRADAYEDRTNRESFQNPDVKSEGIALRTGADVALVAAILAGAGAVVLLLTDIGAPSGPPPAASGNVARAPSSLGRIGRRPVGTLVSW